MVLAAVKPEGWGWSSLEGQGEQVRVCVTERGGLAGTCHGAAEPRRLN